MRLSKLKIQAFKNENFTGNAGSMTMQFNPANVKVSWGETSSKKNKQDGTNQKLSGGRKRSIKKTDFAPATASFNLVFDNTISKIGKPVMEEVEKFKDLCLEINPDVHGPNFLILTWGAFSFKGQLSSLSIDYVLFTPEGTPLRAELACSFKGFQNALSKAKGEDVNSPDMTRVITVVEGDTLPLLCYRHYGSQQHYLKVAKANHLPSATYLRPGQRIVLPPLVDNLDAIYDT